MRHSIKAGNRGIETSSGSLHCGFQKRPPAKEDSRLFLGSSGGECSPGLWREKLCDNTVHAGEWPDRLDIDANRAVVRQRDSAPAVAARQVELDFAAEQTGFSIQSVNDRDRPRGATQPGGEQTAQETSRREKFGSSRRAPDRASA